MIIIINFACIEEDYLKNTGLSMCLLKCHVMSHGHMDEGRYSSVHYWPQH